MLGVMSNFESDNPTLLERCFAAIFSGFAAGATYATWLFFHTGIWGSNQLTAFKETGKWVVLAGALFGFFGGISLVVRLWSTVWEPSQVPFFSLRTATILLVLASIAFGVYKHLPA